MSSCKNIWNTVTRTGEHFEEAEQFSGAELQKEREGDPKATAWIKAQAEALK
ncbi:MAG: hypothetical protein R3C18_26180 [Planctomycetaceae bacterium]